jgi:hypothetical protein
MDISELLDYLGTLDEEDRLVEIEKNADIVYSDEFINLIKGQLQFAAKELAGAGYFDKIHPKEDTETLQTLQSELREQNKLNEKVWLSMINLNKGFNFRNYFEDAEKLFQVNSADEENLFDYDYCIKCGLAGGSDTLCGQCMNE